MFPNSDSGFLNYIQTTEKKNKMNFLGTFQFYSNTVEFWLCGFESKRKNNPTSTHRLWLDAKRKGIIKYNRNSFYSSNKMALILFFFCNGFNSESNLVGTTFSRLMLQWRKPKKIIKTMMKMKSSDFRKTRIVQQKCIANKNCFFEK